MASISGGALRRVGGDSAFQLDARSASFDPDDPSSPLDAFAWSCVDVSSEAAAASVGEVVVPCTDASGAPLSLGGADGVLSFSAGVFAPGNLQFSVVASKDTRTATASSEIEVVPGAPPVVSLVRTSASKG